MRWFARKSLPTDSLEEDNFRLRKELKEQSRIIEQLLEQSTEQKSFKQLIQKAIDVPLDWFDFKELKINDLNEYHTQAQYILNASVFTNEINFLKSNWSKQALLQVPDKPNLRHLERMAWMILGIELLHERLKEVPMPQSHSKEVEEPYKAI